MKRNILFAFALLAAGSLLAKDGKDDLTSAAQKLAAADNYSWKQTTEMPGGGGGGGGRGFGFGGGPVDGMTQKDGLIYTKTMQPGRGGGDPTQMETIAKGTKSASKRGDQDWQTPEERAAARGGGGGGGGAGRGGRGFGGFAPRTPSAIALELIPNLKSITGDAASGYSAELTEAGAKAQLNPFGARGGAAGGAGGGGGFQMEVTGAKGTAKFWVKDGVLSKFSVNVQGSVAFGDNDPIDQNRTTTYEIKDVGTTKINVPDDAKKKVM